VEKTIEKFSNFRFYFLVGNETNWEVAIKEQIWGFREISKGLWNTTNENEVLGYYVTKPLKRLIGFGVVQKKFLDEKLIWKEEKRTNKSIWKYKLKIKNLYVCKNWYKGIRISEPLFLASSRTVIPKDMFLNYLKKADHNWGTNLLEQISFSTIPTK